MAKVLIFAQEKGGVGKSTAARAAAEAVPGADVIEVDSSPRLLELKARTKFFPMRTDREEIERTGGKASRSEFDPVIEALAQAKKPTIVDLGANTARSVFDIMAGLSTDLTEAGIEFGVVVVTTAEPGALAETPILLNKAKAFAKKLFVFENRMRGPIDKKELAKIADGALVLMLDDQNIDEAAASLLQDGGFAMVPKIDPAKLTEKYGLARGARIRRDVTGFRAAAMAAIRDPATWLVS